MCVTRQEMLFAKTGKGVEEDDGPVFDVTQFQLDYLTTPSALLDIGIDWPKVDIRTRTKQTDELYIIAYPHFNVQGENGENGENVNVQGEYGSKPCLDPQH